MISKKIEPIKFTKDGYAKMEAEFERLTQERVEVVQRLQTAREMGDLSENGAYKAAKWELGGIDRELRRLRFLLQFGHVTETSVNSIVTFGTKVTLKIGQKELTFLLVSKYEAKPNAGQLSEDSPIGQAVLGKKVGDTIVVHAPAGDMNYVVMKIE